MRNTRLRILVTVAGLSLLHLGLSCVRAATNDAGAREAGAPGMSAPDAPFTLCTGIYALCTEAHCVAIVNGDGGVECTQCSVLNDASVGQDPCAEVPDSGPRPKQHITSRYAPPRSMAVCQNPPHHQPWAACLDSKCIVDNVPDPTTATCQCRSSANLGSAGEGAWIVDTDLPNPQSCDGQFVSSANLAGANQMTCFLQSKGYPPPTLDGGSWDCGAR
jgi:hypothetical protein